MWNFINSFLIVAAQSTVRTRESIPLKRGDARIESCKLRETIQFKRQKNESGRAWGPRRETHSRRELRKPQGRTWGNGCIDRQAGGLFGDAALGIRVFD